MRPIFRDLSAKQSAIGTYVFLYLGAVLAISVFAIMLIPAAICEAWG